MDPLRGLVADSQAVIIHILFIKSSPISLTYIYFI